MGTEVQNVCLGAAFIVGLFDMKIAFAIGLALVGLFAIVPTPGRAMDQMPMSDAPAHFKPTLSAYTASHEFFVKLIGLPDPIPYEKYFSLRFAVFDGRHPDNQLANASLTVLAGMRHGIQNGFAHGMQSSPKIATKDGIVTADGMYFHMMGKWTLAVTVKQAGQQGVAYFDLPCCDNK